jgi:ketosteroid isomerase-like protein
MGEADNESLIRRAIAAWNANDWQTMQRLIAPDVELVAPQRWPETGTFRGWPAARNLLHGLKEAWSEEHLEILAMESRADCVLVDARWVTRGEGSGLDIETEVWIAYRLEGGRATRIEFSPEEEPVRKAAGITAPGART